MRTLAEIATDIRSVQKQAAEAHINKSDPYLPSWETDYDEQAFDKEYSKLYREFEQLLGIKDMCDFVTSTDVILNIVHKSLEFKQLQENYWHIQECLISDDTTISELTESVEEFTYY